MFEGLKVIFKISKMWHNYEVNNSIIKIFPPTLEKKLDF